MSEPGKILVITLTPLMPLKVGDWKKSSTICFQMFLALMLSTNVILSSSTTEAVNPSCECAYFDGFGHLQNGTFMSPNYPIGYDTDIDCLLYTFVGGQDEIVQITFETFQLQDSEKDGTCLDFVKLFLDLEQPAVNEESNWQRILCGTSNPSSHSFFSKGRALIFEFHSDSYKSRKDVGFIGEFRFLKQSEFKTSGVKIMNTMCDYQIDSSSDTLKGSVFSPYYPYAYPSNTNCHIWFVGHTNQRIKLTVKDLSVPLSDLDCSSSNDYLTIYDGNGPTLTNNVGGSAHDIYKPQKLGHYCSLSSLPDTIISSGPHLFMEFHSGKNPGGNGKGFAVDFEFINKTDWKLVNSKRPLTLNKQTGLYQEPCGGHIHSDGGVKQGVIRSPPGGPGLKSYGPITCQWVFETAGQDRVQLIFTEFDLYFPNPQRQTVQLNGNNGCTSDYDHVKVFVKMEKNEMLSEIGTYCGDETPQQIMSPRNYLYVDFVSNSQEIHNRTGFKAEWKFVKNFGITSGKQTQDFVCSFEYNSSIANNGTVTSPNYPGFYPRKTDCYYTFHGKKTEKVRLSFTYFDVEGLQQCHNETQSDYLEFSNYVSLDRKLARFCGTRSPVNEIIESERDFFRMVFHANAMFDGTGFSALYQFTKQEVKSSVKSVRSSQATAPMISLNFVILSVSLIVGLRLSCQ